MAETEWDLVKPLLSASDPADVWILAVSGQRDSISDSEPAFGEAASIHPCFIQTYLEPLLSLLLPCLPAMHRRGAGISHPFCRWQSQSRSLSLMLLCASASWDLASVCPGCAPLPLQLLSSRLCHPEHPFLPPGVALYIPFPELFRPDLY